MTLVFRSVVIVATFAALLYLWLDRPKAAHVTQVDYCFADRHFAGQDKAGKWVKFWSPAWGTCSTIDRYENI